MLLDIFLAFISPKSFHTQYAFAPLAIAGAMAGYNFLKGAFSKSKADSAISDLEKHHPDSYEITPEQQQSYDRAQKMANSGYTDQEKGAFLGNLASQNNEQYYRSTAMGGQTLAGAVRSGINYGNSRALNDFAARDAALKRQNIQYADRMGSNISQQRNMKTGQKLSEYYQKMQAYGQASKDASATMGNAVNFFGAMAGQSAAGVMGGAAAGAAGTNPNTPGAPYAGPPMANYEAGTMGGSGMDYSNPYGAPRDNSEYSLTNPDYAVNPMEKPSYMPMDNYYMRK